MSGSLISLRSVEIQVVDTGCGIAAEYLPRVFDRFFQVDRTRVNSRGGAGLGLAIFRSIMQLHGGSATVQSVLKQGTTVTLMFPGPEQEHSSARVRTTAATVAAARAAM